MATMQRRRRDNHCDQARPCEICDTCGEYYLSEETTRRVLELAKNAIAQGAEIEALRYAA
jgi:hypothetical protein